MIPSLVIIALTTVCKKFGKSVDFQRNAKTMVERR